MYYSNDFQEKFSVDDHDHGQNPKCVSDSVVQ